jgi:hypothetical protein
MPQVGHWNSPKRFLMLSALSSARPLVSPRFSSRFDIVSSSVVKNSTKDDVHT